MKLIKRFITMFTAVLLIVGLIYGAAWLGDSPVSAQVSKEIEGQFIGLNAAENKIKVAKAGKEISYRMASCVWVYRNQEKASVSDLQPGDALEFILNSKEQAAYIKASGRLTETLEGKAPQENVNATSADAAPTQSATAQPTAPAGTSGENVADHPAASVSGTAEQTSTAVGDAWPWERFSIGLKSRELLLKIKQGPGRKGSDAELYVQTRERAIIHLKGIDAEQWLQLMVQGLPSDRNQWEEALKQRLTSEFQLKEVSPEDWKLDIKWKEGMNQISLPPASSE